MVLILVELSTEIIFLIRINHLDERRFLFLRLRFQNL
ncbi:hypothetical protein VPHF99_0122 [Vibrio phage F99]